MIGQRKAGLYDIAYVHWLTRNKLILWEPHGDTLDDIVRSRRYLDLATDVVEGDDVHGSTYLITRSWANTVIRACKLHGQTLTIVKAGSHR